MVSRFGTRVGTVTRNRGIAGFHGVSSSPLASGPTMTTNNWLLKMSMSPSYPPFSQDSDWDSEDEGEWAPISLVLSN
jgi:hypothetical protein